jgi:hypothetical protein
MIVDRVTTRNATPAAASPKYAACQSLHDRGCSVGLKATRSLTSERVETVLPCVRTAIVPSGCRPARTLRSTATQLNESHIHMQTNTYGNVGVTTGDPDARSALPGIAGARRHPTRLSRSATRSSHPVGRSGRCSLTQASASSRDANTAQRELEPPRCSRVMIACDLPASLGRTRTALTGSLATGLPNA